MKPKLELSKFNGKTKQSVAWINKEEEFFSIHNITSDEEMIKYASMQLEGRAYNWYMWWKVTTWTTKLNWNTFKNDFFKRFEDLKKNTSSQNSPKCNRKLTSMNTPTNGNP